MDENILQNQLCRFKFSRSVGVHWRNLGRCLSVPDNYLDVVDNDYKKCYDKAYQMLTKWLEMTANPSLDVLKNALRVMNNRDLIKVLEELTRDSSERNINNNFYQKDLYKASSTLKMFYLKTYETIDEIRPPLNKSTEINFLEKFVELSVVDADKVQTAVINITERGQLLKQQMSTSILFKKRLKDPSLFERSLLISGIAGIGKTWLLRKCLLDWSNDLIWKNINFVFYLECRQLNSHKNISNINELLDVFYKDILKDFNILLDFNQLNPSIMFIIDGLNEFKYFDQLINTQSCSNEFPIVKVLTEILKFKSVISGRVNTISQYESVVASCKDKLSIQVMGYNEHGIKDYLKNNLIKDTKKAVGHILKESLIAKTMATVPFYLSCMCRIADLKVNENANANDFFNLTMVDLYAYNFVYFYKQHIFNESQSVFKMMENNCNKRFILNICKMAYYFFIENKVIFSSQEMQSFIKDDQIEIVGFIEKIESDYGDYYQFCQLAMMELCVSVYAYNSFSGKEIMGNTQLSSCLSIICGLLNKNQKSFIKYLANLTDSNNEKISLNHVIDVVPKEINFCHDYDDKQKTFMHCFFESQAKQITDDIKESIHERKWRIWINDAKTSYEVSCEKHFVKCLMTSGRKLSTIVIEKIKLTQGEKDLIKQSSTNVVYKGRGRCRLFIDKVTSRWMGSE